MIRIRVNKENVGLVFRGGDLKRVLSHGTHYVLPFDKVFLYDRTRPFIPHIDLGILLQNKTLAAMLHIVEVSDSEIVLVYENKNFCEVLGPGRHAFFKGVINYTFHRIDLRELDAPADLPVSILSGNDLLPYVQVCRVESYEQALLFVEGKYERLLKSGVYYYLRFGKVIALRKADMRHAQLEISGQEILTRDKAALRVNFSLQYRVIDIEKALLDNKDYLQQLYGLAQLALRAFIGTLPLDELLDNKEDVAGYVLKELKQSAQKLGLEVSGAGIKDIILPGEVKEIMNRVLVAQKQAQANTITRREETASTRSLLNTAKLMEENEMLYKLKEMEYVEKIAEKINNISLSGGNQIVEQLKAIFAK